MKKPSAHSSWGFCRTSPLVPAAPSNAAPSKPIASTSSPTGACRSSHSRRTCTPCPRFSHLLINREPTDNKLVLAAKGILRYEIEATGRLAHSAYPELGESAIDKLLDVLHEIRKIPLPDDKLMGRSTLNIGVIAGGHAPNVISDSARAEICFRTVDDADTLRQAVTRAVANRAAAKEAFSVPPMRFTSFDGLESAVVSYTTDVPAFAGACC